MAWISFQMEILKNTVFLLHGQTDNSLTRIDRLFQETDPQLGVGESPMKPTFLINLD